jgi:hypothetical protein
MYVTLPQTKRGGVGTYAMVAIGTAGYCATRGDNRIRGRLEFLPKSPLCAVIAATTPKVHDVQ